MRAIMLAPLLTAALLSAPASLAAARTPALTAAARARSTTIIRTCADGAAARHPAAYTLACGDGGQGLLHLHWRGWGSAAARATGSEYVNLCEPSCVQGRMVTFPATVVASARRRSRGRLAYTRLTITAGTGRPAMIPQVQTATVGGQGPQIS